MKERIDAGRRVGELAANLCALMGLEDPEPDQFAGAAAIAEALLIYRRSNVKR